MKKDAVGVDVALLFPVSHHFVEYSGPLLGGMLRYERYALLGGKGSLTVRVGYLNGFSKSKTETDPVLGTLAVNTSISDIPIWVGSREYFGQDDESGVYVGADMGLNLVRATAEVNGVSASDTSTKVGMNLLIGYKVAGFDAHVVAEDWDFSNLGDFVTLGIGAGYDFARF